MNGSTWILLSAFFLALYDLLKKASVRDNAVVPVLLVSTISGALAYLVALAIGGRMTVTVAAIDRSMVALAAVKTLIVSSSWIFTFCALRTLPITIATPIRASAPALVFVVAFFLYGEIPSGMQGVGMALVFLGYFAFSWAGRHEGIDFFRSRAIGYALAGAFLSAVSSIWDKYVFSVRAASVETVQLLFQVFLVFAYALALVVRRLFVRSAAVFEFRWTIPFVGMTLALSDWLLFTGLSLPGTLISVAALLRRFSVVITFAAGAVIFHEVNLRRKLVALAAILCGVSILVFVKA